jgi:hypothetical protein
MAQGEYFAGPQMSIVVVSSGKIAVCPPCGVERPECDGSDTWTCLPVYGFKVDHALLGCVTKLCYMVDFIKLIAQNYEYQLKGKTESSGEGRVGFLRLIGPPGDIPVFFCSVSPSGRKGEILVNRVREHQSTVAKWLETEP